MAVVENKCDYLNKDITLDEEFPSCLQKCLDSIVKNEGYKTFNVLKRTISTEGGNYLAVLYEADIKGKTANGDKDTNLFIKNIIPNENNKIFSVSEAYLKESFAYNELFRKFAELQDEADVPIEERFKMAKNYESNSEAIILENLTKRGFTTCFRMDVPPLKFVELSVQQLAKFHGLSHVLQKRRPYYFDKKLKTMKPFFKFNDEWKSFTKNMFDMSCKYLDHRSKEKAERFFDVFIEKFPQYLQDTTSMGCCVSHGDYRANNILMREINGEVVEIIPVDYQLLYYGCPVNDFLYFIFSCTDREFRSQHLTNLKDIYYDTLDKFLRYFDMSINDIYPRKEFERQFNERLDYGLMVGMYLVPFCFAADDDIPDIGKDELSTLHFNLDSRYKERIQGIVDDYIEWGLI